VEGLSSPSFQASFVEMEHASHGWFRRDSPMILQESPQRHRRSCYLPLPRCQSWVGAGPTLTKRRPGKFGDFSLGPWTSLVFSLLRNLIHPHLASSTYLFSCKYYFIVIFAVAHLSQNPIVVPCLLPPLLHRILLYKLCSALSHFPNHTTRYLKGARQPNTTPTHNPSTNKQTPQSPCASLP
jgi:hypothetical protein